MVETLETKKTSPEQLAELMVGRRVLLRVEKGPAKPGDVFLSVENLVVKDDLGVTRVKDVSFSVRAGEIVGIAGVAGNGQSELLEAVSGMRDQSSGNVRLKGTPLSLEGDDGAHRAREAGVAHVPEDRQRMGLVMAFEEWENAILGYEDSEKLRQGLHPRHRRRPGRRRRADQEVRHPPAPTTSSRPPTSPAATSRRSSSPARWSAIPKC